MQTWTNFLEILKLFLSGENQNLAKANFWQGTTTETGRYAKAMLYALFGYQGWSYLNFVVDELKDPRRNLPRGIIMSLVGCTSIYLLTNLAYFSVLNKNQILRSAAVAIVSLIFSFEFDGQTLTRKLTKD